MDRLEASSRSTEVLFPEWPVETEFPARREWGLLNLRVTVEHQGSPDLFDITEIDFEPVYPEQTERRSVPAALFEFISIQMRGREEDRETIRHAISESLTLGRRAA